MKKQFLILLITIITLPAFAQKTHSEKEFRAKKEAYITKKAEFTPEEAALFFPIYFELQDLKAANSRKAWSKAKEGLKKETTEAEYDEIFDAFLSAQNSNTQLDKEYLKKCQKFLSNKKIFMALKAEFLFSRNMLKIFQEQK